jgi:hypothetical protein
MKYFGSAVIALAGAVDIVADFAQVRSSCFAAAV